MTVNIVGEIRYCPHCGRAIDHREVAGKLRPHCPSCAVTFFADPKLAVAVLIEQDGKLVLQRRSIDPGMGLWTFPSGFVERGEPPEEAAVREVYEEVGLHVRLTRLVGLYSRPGDVVVLAVYGAEIVDGELISGEETDAVGLFTPETLPPLAFSHDAEIISTWYATRRAEEANGDPSRPERHPVPPPPSSTT